MIETDRLVAADTGDQRDDAVDRAIRPRRLDEYIGQRAVREQMERQAHTEAAPQGGGGHDEPGGQASAFAGHIVDRHTGTVQASALSGD